MRRTKTEARSTDNPLVAPPGPIGITSARRPEYSPCLRAASTPLPFLLFCCLLAIVSSLSHSIDAQEQCVPADAHELCVPAGHTRRLPAGAYRFDRIRLGPDAAIELSGTTRLMTSQLITEASSSIRYVGSDATTDAQSFDFVVLDARGMRGRLLVDGNGRSRPPQAPGRPRSNKGEAGADGLTGEDGMNIELSLFQVPQTGQVTLVAHGGDGGAGGAGGQGVTHVGQEHECQIWHPDRNCLRWQTRDVDVPGEGGDGGNGGNGGASGQIRVFLVHEDSATDPERAMLFEFLREQVLIVVRAGRGGDGGAPGAGGRGRGLAGARGRAGAAKVPRGELVSAGAWLARKAQPPGTEAERD